MPVRSNLQRILDERDMSIRELSRRTGCRLDSVRILAKNEMARFPNELIYKVCRELRISIGELLYLTDEGEDEEKAQA